MSSPPPEFESWEQCRDYYSLETLFLGQLFKRSPTRGNERRYIAAQRLAEGANGRCSEPFQDDEMPSLKLGEPESWTREQDDL